MYDYLIILQDCMFIGFCYILLFNVFTLNCTFNSFNYSKKMYIIKNLIKSFTLCYLTFISFNNIIPQFYYTFDNNIIKKYASLYVSNDIMAIIIVRRLSLTTKIHHSITTLLLFYTFNIDFNDYKQVGTLLVIYTTLSSYTFIVNFYLGIRFFKTNLNEKNSEYLYHYIKNRYIDNIRYIAYYIYKYVCLFNWFIHICIILFKLINNQLYMIYYFYFFLLYFIVNDDLILMSWLKN